MPVTIPSSRAIKFRRLIGRSVFATFLVLCALLFDLSPSVPEPKAPSAEQARRARDVVQRMHVLLDTGKGFATLQIDRDDLTSATTLASSLGKLGRFDSSFDSGTFIARASRSFGPVWFNVEAHFISSPQGFPKTRLKIGNLPLGPLLGTAVINGARIILRWRGISVPPLNDLVRSVRVEPHAIIAKVHFPLHGRFANELSGLRKMPVNAELTAKIYCGLIMFDREQPTTDFAIVVRRAFLSSGSALTAHEQSRAAFVALAMYTVSPGSGRLAGDATNRIARCRTTPTVPLLDGRDDLPKHWALSAALAVSLGGEVGTAMGEWKELSDSRAGGSGFSFVDLSADRAGLAIARQATDPATVGAAVTRLRTATDEDLLPLRALALSEGLSERQFVDKYSTIDSTRFTAAIARIDRVIANTIGKL